MEIKVKGRHTAVSDRFRDQVMTKLAKLERLDNKLIRLEVEVVRSRNPRIADEAERVELTIHSRGPAVRAEATADDRFAALDLAMDKLERQLRRIADRRKVHHGMHGALGLGELTAAIVDIVDLYETEEKATVLAADVAADEVVAEEAVQNEDGNLIDIEMEGDGPLVVREKFHSAEPMTIDQALLEMELVGHDFYLFRDKESGQPSVIYNRRGYNYGVLRLVEP